MCYFSSVLLAVLFRLRPHHLRKLKMKFDSIDIDGSGNIDADEFFEAVGEQRTPFTDKLFSMIGAACVCIMSCVVLYTLATCESTNVLFTTVSADGLT